MGTSKVVTLFLIDGTMTGRVKASLANHTGVALKIPKLDLEDSADRAELSYSGIYFLFGEEEESQRPLVYVGQAGERKNQQATLGRLKEHMRKEDKSFFKDAIILTTTDNSFGPTEISYLENRFYNLAKNAKRFTVKNKVEPTIGNVTEEKVAELEDFIEQAIILTGVLGYKAFETVGKVANKTIIQDIESDNSISLSMTYNGYTAKGSLTNEGFLVFSGSQISPQMANSVPDSVKRLREFHAESISNGCLLEDILFTSPSQAACFVGGASLSGNKLWKIQAGQTLGEWKV
ncbi:TPA: GIY-YIG nuclease family protein [Streptococcus suis]|nr:GIY-YIG nuclease family protein [Streptococcus suis]